MNAGNLGDYTRRTLRSLALSSLSWGFAGDYDTIRKELDHDDVDAILKATDAVG